MNVFNMDAGLTRVSSSSRARTEANWLQNMAGTSSPFVAEVGQHFYTQFADFKAAYWINPSRDTLP